MATSEKFSRMEIISLRSLPLRHLTESVTRKQRVPAAVVPGAATACGLAEVPAEAPEVELAAAESNSFTSYVIISVT